MVKDYKQALKDKDKVIDGMKREKEEHHKELYS